MSSGRWTPHEHRLFIEGLARYGKDWKRIESLIKSRNGAQIRSHAQKFFLRMTKEYKRIIKSRIKGPKEPLMRLNILPPDDPGISKIEPIEEEKAQKHEVLGQKHYLEGLASLQKAKAGIFINILGGFYCLLRIRARNDVFYV